MFLNYYDCLKKKNNNFVIFSEFLDFESRKFKSGFVGFPDNADVWLITTVGTRCVLRFRARRTIYICAFFSPVYRCGDSEDALARHTIHAAYTRGRVNNPPGSSER